MDSGRRALLLATLASIAVGACSLGGDSDNKVNSRLFALIDADPMAKWRPTTYLDEKSQRNPYSSFPEHVPSATLTRTIRTSNTGSIDEALRAAQVSGWQPGPQSLVRELSDPSVSSFRLIITPTVDGLEIYLSAAAS